MGVESLKTSNNDESTEVKIAKVEKILKKVNFVWSK